MPVREKIRRLKKNEYRPKKYQREWEYGYECENASESNAKTGYEYQRGMGYEYQRRAYDERRGYEYQRERAYRYQRERSRLRMP